MTDTQLFRLLTDRMDRMELKIDALVESVSSLRGDMVALKVKMAFIGGIAGLVVSGAITIFANIV